MRKDCFVALLLAMTDKGVIASCPERRALSMEVETGTIPGRHSRAGGNPVFSAWIPGLAPLARNDGLPYEWAWEWAFCF